MRRPLIPLALAAVVGAVLAFLVPASPWLLALAGISLVAASLVSRVGLIACLSVAALAIAWVRGDDAWRRPPKDDLSRLLTDEPLLARVEGRVAFPPIVLDRDVQHPPDRSTFIVDVERARFGDGESVVSGRMLVRLPGIAPRLDWGDRVRIDGRVHRPRRPRSPGALDVARSLRANDVRVVLDGECDANVARITHAPAWHPLRIVGRLRARFAETLSRALPPREATLAIALLIGERRDFPRELRERFQRCGTIHVFAISGAHVVILAGLVRLALGLVLGSRPRAMAAALLAFVAIYTLIAGAAPSVLRASWTIAVYVGADLLFRRRDPLQALAASLLGLVLAWPPNVTDVGFQLSYVSVASLVLLVPRFDRHAFPRALVRPLEALALSAAASFGTTPLVLWHFDLVVPVSLLANLAIGLPAAAALGLGMGLLMASLVVPPIVALLAPLLRLSLDALVASQWLFDVLPAAHFYLPTPPLGSVAAAYAVLAIVAWRARGRWQSLIVIGGGIAATLVVVVPCLLRSAAPAELAVVDVGQGSCTYIHFEEGATILYDAGSSGYPEIATTVVAPFLWNRGVRRIDWLVLSHEDADHVNAAAAIAERFSIGGVAVSCRFGADPSCAGARALARVAAMGVPVRRVSRGDEIPIAGTRGRVRVVHPPHDVTDLVPASDNDASLSLRVETDGKGVLLLGDLQEAGVRAILAGGDDLTSDFLVVPHHGARCPALADLFAAACPREVFVSARRSFPAEDTMATLAASRVPWSATYLEGTIVRSLRR
ncbi:MAG: ComEC/Rec2 family competence protein [Planctomycetes bacterium]|nr:ComEC/Rec2 family competence protein [Planctomycetota bacterium]